MNFEISKESLQKVADYLVTRPWHEVNTIIGLLANLKPIAEVVPTDSVPELTLAQNGKV
jgi:hypothetical protein